MIEIRTGEAVMMNLVAVVVVRSTCSNYGGCGDTECKCRNDGSRGGDNENTCSKR